LIKTPIPKYEEIGRVFAILFHVFFNLCMQISKFFAKRTILMLLKNKKLGILASSFHQNVIKTLFSKICISGKKGQKSKSSKEP